MENTSGPYGFSIGFYMLNCSLFNRIGGSSLHNLSIYSASKVQSRLSDKYCTVSNK